MTQQLFRQALYSLFLLAVVVSYLSQYTQIDLRLADAMYDTASQAFPWKDDWFASIFMHRWVKFFLIALGLSLLGLLAASSFHSFRWLSNAARKRLSVVALSFLAIPAVISAMKSQSMHHCPWDVQRYGGYAPYLRLFDSLPEGVKAGHCFPAGHASSGLWLAAFAVFWLPRRPRMAVLMLAVGLIPGLVLGWVQQMRGAHFLTHTVWSAWIACLTIVVLARLILNEPSQERWARNAHHEHTSLRH